MTSTAHGRRKWLPCAGLSLVALMALTNTAAAQWDSAVEQWRPVVEEACSYHGCSTEYVLGLISCESGGNPDAVSERINPGTGTHDYGLLQVSTIWGGQHMGPVEQIWWTAANLAVVWWACG